MKQNKIKIILAEDDPFQRQIDAIILRKGGYDFQMFEDGAKALDYIKKNPDSKPDIVLADINMPEIDGFTLLKKIKELYPEIYTIILTGSTDKEVVKKAFDLGATDFIRKPLDKYELNARLNILCKTIEMERALKITLNELEKRNIIIEELNL